MHVRFHHRFGRQNATGCVTDSGGQSKSQLQVCGDRTLRPADPRAAQGWEAQACQGLCGEALGKAPCLHAQQAALDTLLCTEVRRSPAMSSLEKRGKLGAEVAENRGGAPGHGMFGSLGLCPASHTGPGSQAALPEVGEGRMTLCWEHRTPERSPLCKGSGAPAKQPAPHVSTRRQDTGRGGAEHPGAPSAG